MKCLPHRADEKFCSPKYCNNKFAAKTADFCNQKLAINLIKDYFHCNIDAAEEFRGTYETLLRK